MVHQDYLKLIYQLQAASLIHPGGWIETSLKQTDLLVYESLDDDFCLMAMHCVTDQDVLRTFFDLAKSWGYNSPAYMTGYHWDCSLLDVRVFFKNNNEGAAYLQKRTDKIIGDLAGKINELTEKWR